jgi:lauroyl/myristoyl acyltransferase
MKKAVVDNVLERLVKTLPPRQVYAITGAISGGMLRGKTKRLLEDTRVLFPDKPDAWLQDVVRRQRLHRAWVAVDKYLFPRLSGEKILAMNDAESIARIRRLAGEALAKGKGAIVYTMHYGRPTMSPMLLAALGFPCIALVRNIGGGGLREQEADVARSRGAQFVEAKGGNSGLQLARGLKANKLLFVLVDGGMSAEATPVEFVGQKVPFSLKFERLARRTGAELIACVIYTGDDPTRTRVDARAVALPEEGLSPEMVGRHIVAPLEEMVLADVGQWYGINRLFRMARLLEQDARGDG